ncbi:MAG: hypothetical protein IJ240_01735 [Clostridia bacterium]|nr:hypothetical protein [Clostridia bacterium]
MKTRNRSNALLVELLIVVMFFMLAAAVLMQVFAAARRQADRAGILTEALTEAQNVADRLYAAKDPDGELAAMGFERQQDAWVLIKSRYLTEVSGGTEWTEAGRLLVRNVRVTTPEGEELLALPCVRYEEERP